MVHIGMLFLRRKINRRLEAVYFSKLDPRTRQTKPLLISLMLGGDAAVSEVHIYIKS